MLPLSNLPFLVMAENESRYEFSDGISVVVNSECPTCQLTSSLLTDLGSSGHVTVFSQDDPSFPASAEWVRDDSDLAFSWHNDIEAVPTLVRVVDGKEVERLSGWNRKEWERLLELENLAPDLVDHKPGCGSLSVSPDRVDELEVKFGGKKFVSRRVEIASLEDEMEAMFDRGWSDGLPVVPPTEARVNRMLAGTSREPDDIVAVIPPNLAECSVEKVAINAVMAGCLPEYLPVVIACLEAICTDEFNMHGVLATTMGVGPIFVVSGPITERLDMNSGINALGHGNRANTTIGRAVQLVLRNIGGGKPGGIDRATLGHMGKLGFCFAEAPSPWENLSESFGFSPEQNTVTAFTGEGPRIIVDQKSRSPESLTRLLAEGLKSTISPRMVLAMDAMLVISPEHLSRFIDAGWSRAQFIERLSELLVIDSDEIIEGAGDIEDGIPSAFAGNKLPKFRPGGLLVVHAGGPAGLFSAIIGGWLNGAKGSDPVAKEIIL